MEGLLNLASAFGLSTSAGLNAYIPMLTVALLARFTRLIQLEAPWNTLTHWWVIVLLVILLAVEELADKIPAVDSVNDVIQTLIRPTAGAILFAANTQTAVHMHPVLAMTCGVILAGSVHVVKSSARPVVTATTAGVGNPIVSTIEDFIAALMSFIAVIFPYLIVLWILLLGGMILMVMRWRRRRREAV